MFVADQGNSRIQKFLFLMEDSFGEFEKKVN